MTFFESLLALLLAAILLLQLARRLGVPYPAMLASAGVLLAMVPGTPDLPIDPQTALALFIAPVLLDAAFDFPLALAWRLWRPLVTLAVVAVLATTVAVAWIGHVYAGLPIAAAIVLGAIVAPPDAAAATAVMRQVSLPKITANVLRGESLFNDATALLLFAGGLAVVGQGSLTAGVGLRVLLAAPGGIALGILFALLMRKANRFVAGTLGGNLLQFVNAFATWLLAEHLHLSAVLAVVALAMTAARGAGSGAPRMRVQSFAVWAAVVFLLNVVAFLLMGMQARAIVGRMPVDRLDEAAGFAAMVVAAVIVVRFAVVMAWNRIAALFPAVRGGLPQPSWQQSVLVGWSGMRGLVTLATAFALPGSFPQRDLVVLTAFGVVLATLVVQGLTLSPLIRLLKLDRMEDGAAELTAARTALARAALAALDGKDGPDADHLRYTYLEQCAAVTEGADGIVRDRYRTLALAAVSAERNALDRMREEEELDVDIYYQLQEGLDWRELTVLADQDRRIEES